MKKGFFILSLILCMFLTACTSDVVPEYDTDVSKFLSNMTDYLKLKFEEQTGSEQRSITDDLNGNNYDLKPLTILAFGSNELNLHFYAYESDAMANAAISSFEVPPESDKFSDCAFVIWPNANINAPIMHGDGLKYMAGMGGKLSMDFYMINPAMDNDTIEDFFLSNVANLENAMALVEEWRVPEGSSSLTEHLNPYKTKYRLEIKDPGRDNATAITRYTEAAYEAFTIYVDAYLNSLNSVSTDFDESLMQANITGMISFIKNQVENDFVYQMGGLILGDDLDYYFLDGFWRENVYYTRK